VLNIINNEKNERNSQIKRRSHPIVWRKNESKILRSSVSSKSTFITIKTSLNMIIKNITLRVINTKIGKKLLSIRKSSNQSEIVVKN
jgi:hypothetical protein